MVDKQEAGFKFGKHRLEVLEQIGEIKHNGRTYRLVRVRTNAGQEYISLRLYNKSGRFIKQFLTEPELSDQIAGLYKQANV
jgi:hypothetical protein